MAFKIVRILVLGCETVFVRYRQLHTSRLSELLNIGFRAAIGMRPAKSSILMR